MSEAPTAIRFEDVGKMYKIFSSRGANLVDALGIARWVPRRKRERYREFWALRGIDFELAQGERLGIIGRNGAGKSTLLKLITGNLAPTEGRIAVQGDVQALLEIGGGLHPEFTGRENIHAALVHLGLSAAEIAAAEEEIADFTELGAFLDQPFKTYSLGMQARLSFAIGTTVKPEILIIDEILGAGDAYFFGKSTARMQELIEGGASVLLVSHGLDQIIRFCEHTIWIDRGRIVMSGPSVEVVKAYERFIRQMEDKRLQAKNRKARSRRFDAFEREGYTDYLTVEISAAPGARVDVGRLTLRRDGEPEDSVEVGGAQDGEATQSAYAHLDGGGWSDPRQEGRRFFRTIEGGGDGAGSAQVVFNLWFFYPDSAYELELEYRTEGEATLAVGRSGRLDATTRLEPGAQWSTASLAHSEPDERRRREATPEEARAEPRVSRWPGEGSLMIDEVRLLDSSGEEQAVFAAGSELTLSLRLRATRSGPFEVIPVAAMYRIDGILVSNHPGERLELDLAEDESRELELAFGPLNLGNGRYLFSVALYRTLSNVDRSTAYDLIDRSYEFEVTGNEPYNNGVFRHPAAWSDTVPAAEEKSELYTWR